MSWYADPGWWQVGSSFLVALVAVFFGLDFQKKFLKPKFTYQINTSDQKINGSTNTIFRILVTNNGRRAAKETTAMAVEIKDKVKGRYIVRKNFIHMPLNWTHKGFKPQLIPSRQGIYLDIARYDIFADDEVPSFALMTLGVEESALYSLDSESKLKIRLGESYGYIDEITITIKWSVEEMCPKLSISKSASSHQFSQLLNGFKR